MSNIFKRTNYNEEEKRVISAYVDELKTQNRKINFTNEKRENPELTVFETISNGDHETRVFFIKEYLQYHLDQIHSTSNKNKKEYNSVEKFKTVKKTNGELFIHSFNKIKECFAFYSDYDRELVDILSSEKNIEKLNEIAIDQDLNKFTSYIVQSNVKLNHNNLLNLSIRNGNQMLFEEILKNFKGKKENFKEISDSPFFWQPLLFHKNKDFSPKYIYDQLLDHNFKISRYEIIKMKELAKDSPQKLKFYLDLDKRMDQNSINQRSLKF